MTHPPPGLLRVVIVDDQPLARLRLDDLLSELDRVEVVGQASDGHEALRVLAEVEPHLVFLDIQMPGPTGLDVLRQAKPRPLAIFTTAHDEHAVAAFELAAIDYLLKPFGGDRLRAAVERARAWLVARGEEGGPESDPPAQRLKAVEPATGPLERLYVRSRGRVVPIRLDEVEHLEADGDYVTLWVGGRDHLVRVPLTRLMARLRPDRFVRIHRSHAINLDRVRDFQSYDGTRLRVTLESGKSLVASRSRSAELRKRFLV